MVDRIRQYRQGFADGQMFWLLYILILVTLYGAVVFCCYYHWYCISLLRYLSIQSFKAARACSNGISCQLSSVVCQLWVAEARSCFCSCYSTNLSAAVSNITPKISFNEIIKQMRLWIKEQQKLKISRFHVYAKSNNKFLHSKEMINLLKRDNLWRKMPLFWGRAENRSQFLF